MPNWCSNTLTVYGPKAVVDKFIEDNKGSDDHEDTKGLPLSLDRALPTPRNEDGTLIGEGMDIRSAEVLEGYWYNWRTKNWGTKWDLSNETHFEQEDLGEGQSRAVYYFDSAWSPPVEWLEVVAPRYPELSMKIEYREEGVGFEGYLGFYHGREVERDERDLYGAHSGVESYEDLYG